MENVEWASLIEEFYKPIYRYCVQLLGTTAEAEDVTQETFIRVYKKIASVRDHAALRGWIYTIARNLCRDRQRWFQRTFRILRENVSAELSPAPSTIGRHLLSAISSLPLRQREVFILRHFHEFSTEETANVLNISEGTVKSHLKRAVDTLREFLDPQGMPTTDKAVSPSNLLKREAGI